ncbi:hypothetical protein GEMRC1_006232 [Eukaryota sp. GEM-RC1]
MTTAREEMKKFLKRGKLPVDSDLNLSLTPSMLAEEVQFLVASDLYVGKELTVFKHLIVIVGCDKFTSDWLRDEGIQDDATVMTMKDLSRDKSEKRRLLKLRFLRERF